MSLLGKEMNFITTAYAAEEGAGLTVHLNPEIVGYLGGVPITSTFLSVWLVMVLLIIASFIGRSKLSLVPGKFQVLIELIIGGIYDYISSVLGSKKLADTYFPIIVTIFIFVLSINWFGLLPGVGSIGFHNEHGHLVPLFYPGSTDLNITLGFAIVSFLTIEIAAILALGVIKYSKKYFNFRSPMSFALGILELVSSLARLVSFSFRLFGNIFAGKTLLLVVMLFVPYLLPVSIYAYELFAGLIQAAVFAILTLFFIKSAITESHH